MPRTVRWTRWAAATALTGLVAAGVVDVVPAHAVPAAPAAVYVVNTGDDVNDGACDATHCSLREAIGAANATPDLDRITFSVGAATPGSSLPNITAPVEIDGGAAPDCAGVPGVVVDGSAAGANANGLTLAGGSAAIRGLVLSNWSGAGVMITSANNVVQCTYAGTNLTGTTAAANQRGVVVSSGGISNLIGGSGVGEGNVLSGNDYQGLLISGFPADSASGNVVQGNLIGTDTTGTVALGNGLVGIALWGTDNLVGGADPAARNVVSGNADEGIVTLGDASNNTVEGNYLGVDITGNVALGNGSDGIFAAGSGPTGDGGLVVRNNVISGNGASGVQVYRTSAGNTVEDNLIGVGADGTTAVGNGSASSGYGVDVSGRDNVVRHNTIANNDTGVAVHEISWTVDGVTVSENSIDAQGGLGIDLAIDGVTANDPDDGDSGSNGLQNFPVLTAASTTAADGTLDSAPTSTYRVEVFASPACDSSGFGEGGRFVGAADVTTDAGGLAAFSVAVTGVADGEAVTATATAPDGSTSELSQCEAAVAGPEPATTFVVNTGNDVNDGGCDTTHCSLREAIGAANATPVEDRIEFTAGIGTIEPGSSLPPITAPLEIDGGTAPDCAGVPGVVLNGSAAGTSASGLTVTGGSAAIRGLVLSNWGQAGITIRSSNNVVQCSYAGTDATGTTAAANQYGIDVSTAGGSNLIGGPGAGEGNVLSGNQYQGLQIGGSGADGNVVQGNLIGTDPTGTIAVEDGGFGIGIDLGGSGNLVGGAEPGARNVASGNGQYGVRMRYDSSNNTVDGNYIGVDITGNVALGNDHDGVFADGPVGAASTGHVVRNNVISGNHSSGVQLNGSSTGNTVEDNLIGIGADGTTALGNGLPGFPGSGWGVLLNGSDNIVRHNTIANNGAGVTVGNSTSLTIGGVTISENSIDAHVGSGIDLANDYRTLNDAGDTDTGPNGLQNFPVLTAASASAVEGTLDSAPTATYRVEVFASPACDDTGFGEGARFVGSADVTTDAGGLAAFSVAVTGVAEGEVVTATATAPDGSTSEFSECEAQPELPTVLPRGGIVTEGDTGSTVLEVLVELSEASSQTVTVDWETVDTFAQPQVGVDYRAASGTVTFLPGETSATVPVTVYGDTLDEDTLYGAEWGAVRFHSPTNAVIGSGFGQYGLALIGDDDPPPVIKPIGGSVVEGNTGTATMNVRIDLSVPSGRTVSVSWSTIDTLQQPQAGVDYQPASGTLTFLPGETSKTVPVTVFGDLVDEPGQAYGAEWGAVQLSSPTNATFGSGTFAKIAFALIFDDD